MENSKLMTPLFYDGNFDREGHRMRAVFEKEISDGTQTYRLWRAAGKPDLDHPRADNDKYVLHVEINGYLLPLGMTDFTWSITAGSRPWKRACMAEVRSGGDILAACAHLAETPLSMPHWQKRTRKLRDMETPLSSK